MESIKSQSANYQSPIVSLLLVDVDRFKEYNDSFGHQAGDNALQKVAKLLHSVARSGDFVARFGGEEFSIILPATGHEDAYSVAERMRKAVSSTSFAHRVITVSIGVSTFGTTVQDESSLIMAADKALYRAKREGRNRTVHADSLGIVQGE